MVVTRLARITSRSNDLGTRRRPAMAIHNGRLQRPQQLRLSVTDRCNLRCRYCMPAGGIHLVEHQDLVPLEELAAATAWLADVLPIERVRLTGGEPLVRKGLPELVRCLRRIESVREVSATTNGVLLPELAAPLAAAGLARVNVSLDTLDAGRFAELTRGGRLAETLAGLDAAEAAGLAPVKLNSVLLADSWREDVPSLIDLAARRGLELRFIELMRTGTEAGWATRHLVAASDVRSWLVADGARVLPLRSTGPARRELVEWRGLSLFLGWITPMSHPFCADCTRLRLDARGRLRRCLMDPQPFPLVDGLRRGNTDEVRGSLSAYLAGKRPPTTMGSELPMAAVGG